MTSEAQKTANRANAQASTGPRSTEGKARVARNSVTLGLFSARDLVHPGEQPEYDELRDALEAELLPATVMERTLAMEILHATWRLRRCALTEAGLDPDDLEAMTATQATIDRARAHARNNLHRATASLSRLQTERHLRAQLAPEVPETLVSHQAIAKTLANDTRRRLNQRKLEELDNFEAIFANAAYSPDLSSPLQSKPNSAAGPTSSIQVAEDANNSGAGLRPCSRASARPGPAEDVSNGAEPPDPPNFSAPLQSKPNYAHSGVEDANSSGAGLRPCSRASARPGPNSPVSIGPPNLSRPLQSKPNFAATTTLAGDPHDILPAVGQD